MTLSKREEIKAQRTKKKRQKRITTVLWVGGVIIFLLVLFASPTIINSLKPAGSFVAITPTVRPMEDGKAFGDPNAKVKIEVYEDFQCPACKSFTDVVETQLMQSTYISSGQVYYEFIQHPFLDSNSITKEFNNLPMQACALWHRENFGITMTFFLRTRMVRILVHLPINAYRHLLNQLAWI